MMVSCHTKQDVPVVKPVKFDHKDYLENLIKSRDSLKENQQIVKNQNTSIKAQVPKQDSLISNSQPEPPTDTLKLQIVYGKAKVDTLKLARQKMVFEFDVGTATYFDLKVIPADSLANLRITQIFDADGNADGPFGQEIKYPVNKKGIYKVLVSESLMNGESYSGRFLFEVKLGWGKFEQ